MGGGCVAKEKKPVPETKPLEISLPADTSAIPILYANQIIVNFTGNEFLVTLAASVPEPWMAGQLPQTKVTARVLGRFAFAIHHWRGTVASIQDQIDKLTEQGAFDRPPSPPETPLIGR
jgi:hypothetical protein